MGAFKNWLAEADLTQAAMMMGAMGHEDAPSMQNQEFKRAFEQFKNFVDKWDKLGIARTWQVTLQGTLLVCWDFAQCLYSKVSGNKAQCDLKSSMKNLVKVIPASVLFGGAAYVTPMVMGMGAAGAAMAGIKVLQYLYAPFWMWASANVNNHDPKVAEKAKMIMSIIPDQYKKILAANPSAQSVGRKAMNAFDAHILKKPNPWADQESEPLPV